MKKKKKYRTLRRLGRFFLLLLLLFVVVILFVRSPWGQDIIVGKAVSYISEKTGTKVEIKKLFVTFAGGIQLEGLFLEDTKGDTLIYSKSLEADVALYPLVFGNQFNLKELNWNGLTGNIERTENSEKFNFDFLMEALVATDTVATIEETPPMQINIGEMSLSDFKISYTDDYLGIDTKLQLGKLHLDADAIDLESMRFGLDDLQLSDSEITYQQTKPFAPDDTTAIQLPYLWIDDMDITNVNVKYNSFPDGLNATFSIGNFQLNLPKADLAKNEFEVENLVLKSSRFSIALDDINSPNTEEVTESTNFEWPEYKIEVAKIDLDDNILDYRLNQQISEQGIFNPEAISISNFELKANDINYRPKEIGLQLQQLAFAEKSGFRLRQLVFDAKANNTSTSISKLKFQTDNSTAKGKLNLSYASFEKLISTPELTNVDLDIFNIEIGLRDAYPFQPELAANPYLEKAAQKPITGSIKAEGTLSEIQLPLFDINWGSQTSLRATGQLKNVLATDSLAFNFKNIKALSTRKDILQFISEADLGISIPKNISLEASLNGTVSAIDIDAALAIPEGTAKLSGKYYNAAELGFNGNLKIDSLQLDRLLKNEQLGLVSFIMDASVSGTDLNSLNASLTSEFSQLELKDYDFSNLLLDGDIVNGIGAINLNFKDKNLNLKARTKVDLDSIESKINLNLNLIGADLYALGITQEQIKTAVNLDADFSGNADDFTIDAILTEGIAVYDNEQYRLGNIDLSAHLDETTTNLSISSDFLNGILQSNTSPDKLNIALEQQFRGYFPNAKNEEVAQDSIKLKLDMALTPIPILTEVFFRGVQRLDSINLQADFDAASKNLNAKLYMPSATYNGIAIDSLNVSVQGNATDLDFSAGLASVNADPIQVKRTSFNGNMQNGELLLDFSAYDDQDELVHVASELELAKDTVLLHINPSKLLFNKKEWVIPQDNRITFSTGYMGLRNVNLSRNEQSLSFSNKIIGITREHFGVEFNNFKLQTFISLLNPDEALAKGLVKGKFVIENPFDSPGIVADFKINSLEVMQNPLGNLSLDAASKGSNKYDFNLALKDGGADLDLTGDYNAADTGALLNLDLDLNRVELGLIESLSEGSLKNSKGHISGGVTIQGTTVAPLYKGQLDFNQVEFNVASLNSIFKIADESLRIDNSGLYLETFRIGDANDNTFTLNGTITTSEITNPSFEFSMSAEQFQLLNSTVEDNELFYGKASIDADVTVKGNLELPKVAGKIRVRKITDLTYVVPESQLDVEEQDGVVIFVNRENPDAILTRNDREETPSFFKGMDVKAILEVADDAVFRAIIDKKAGDNLQVSGDAALNLNIEPNGRINLSGRYVLNSGHYETSLYNLVKRRFDIEPGGSITWLGDPTDAKLDVTAIYKVETSASPLLAAVTSGEDASLSEKYRQVLPFLVYLNVDGELLTPTLSFALDMPVNQQGYLGGAVYSSVQQLNEQESELNKQVFSLLALNRFFPTTGSDGSSGGTAAIARDNVNKVLSGQLNAFSDKIFGKTGFELDFNLDSFTDYQGDTPQDRTQLNINANKKLFNDRLIVTAGSALDVEGSAQTNQEEVPIIGNVSLEYLVTENGRYRLKGFRKNEFTNVIDGQLIITGVALIFQREFNKFSELFSPIKKKEVKNKEEELNNTIEKEKKE